MKKLISHLLIASLLMTLHLSAQAPAGAGAVREFKDLLKHIPSKDFLKLRGNTKAETAMAMSKDITTRELEKESTFRVKVGKVEAWPFPNKGITGWRLAVQDEKVKEGSLNIIVSAWIYVHTDPDGLIPKIRPGKEVTVSGKILRADITAVDVPKLNVDLVVPVLKVAK